MGVQVAVAPDSPFEVSPIAKPCYTQPKEASCDIIKENKTNDYWIADQPGGYYYGNWASCQGAGEACAIPLNDSSLIPPNATCNQGSVPKSMINVTSIGDIVLALDISRSAKMPLVIKNTGHDWKGRSSAPDSIGLWMHNFRLPSIEMVLDNKFKPLGCPDQQPEEMAVRFGAGEQFAALYDFVDHHGLAVLGGTCPTVGVAGWLHGGGHSPLTPWYGMGVDNVLQVTVITPDTGLQIANEYQNSDLFFAVRGGGGGTFGVVTEIVYKVVPKFQVQELSVNLTSLSGAAVAEFFDILTSGAISWAQKGWGGYIKTKTSLELVNANTTYTDAAADMAPLISFFERQSITCALKTQPSWYAYYDQRLKPPAAHIGQWSGAVASRLLPPDVFSGQSRQGLMKILLDLHNKNLNLWLMLVTPTRFNHTKTSALHPSWATAIWSVRINDKWDQFADPPLTGVEYRSHFVRVHEAMDPLRQLVPNTGVSINEADIWEEEHPDVFWGRLNHEKLKAIKTFVDRDNVLTNYQAVNWEGAAAARYKCYPQIS